MRTPPRIPVGPTLGQLMSLAHAADQPVLMCGDTGIGKSEVVHAAAELRSKQLKRPVDVIVRDLSIMEPVDLAGMPFTKKDRMLYAPPAFLPTGGHGFLVLEELNRAPRHMQAPCLQLLTARRLNDYCLPPGWLPVATINPSDDDAYSGTYELDAALLARFLIVHVHADAQQWLTWARCNGVHPRVIDFVAATPRIFDEKVSNPRAWTYVSRILQSHAGQSGDDLRAHAIAGLVGSELAHAFLAFVAKPGDKTRGDIDPQHLLADYASFRKQIRRAAKAGDSATCKAVVTRLLSHLQDPDREADTESNPQHVEALRTLAADLPAEWSARLTEEHPWIVRSRS